MEVEFAFLARAAQHNVDGTLDIQGCGVRDFVVAEVPVRLPLLLVMQLRMDGGRTGPRRLAVSLSDTHGRIKSPPLRELEAGLADLGARMPGSQPPTVALPITPLVGLPGTYQLVVQDEGRRIASVPFQVALERESSPPLSTFEQTRT